MRGLLIADDHAARALRLPHRLALHQHRDPRRQPVDLAGLPRDHLVQLIGEAFQMRQPLFDFRAHLAPFPVPG